MSKETQEPEGAWVRDTREPEEEQVQTSGETRKLAEAFLLEGIGELGIRQGT